MARSTRILYRNVHGRSLNNYNWDAITAKSAVVMTAAEWLPTGGIGGFLTGRPHLGAANVYVTNIGPHNPEGGTGGVEFVLNVDWPSPIHAMVTITVHEDVEDVDVVG